MHPRVQTQDKGNGRPPMLTSQMIDLITNWPLGFVASIDAQGRARVSPKGTFRVLSPTSLGFTDIRSPGTVANLRARPNVEVNFIDVLSRRGARLLGTATVHDRETPGFDTQIAGFAETWPDLADRFRALVEISVTECKPLSSPIYDNGAEEQEIRAAYAARVADLAAGGDS